MFVINPDPYLLPCYRISPFCTTDITGNNRLPKSDAIDSYFENRFDGAGFAYFYNGREAIHKALSHYNLQKDDLVSIVTSSQNFYISSCVTSEIEKFCQWNREINNNTRIIFVNHEFGYPYENLEALKNYKLPIIEDCAHSFFSKDEKGAIGTIGDFVIYSFPKMFPIQIGGLLRSNTGFPLERNGDIETETLAYIKSALSHHIHFEKEIIKKRIDNYLYLKAALAEPGFSERFELKSGIVPGVFLFKVNTDGINLQDLKVYLNAHGIQSSVFYGEQAYFIPCHQNLTNEDLDYFITVLKSFLK